MIRRVALCLLSLCAAAGATDAPPPAERGGGELAVRVMTITIPAPTPAGDGTVELPYALAELLKKGWRISQTTSLGASPDGKGFLVVLVLDRADPLREAHLFNGGMPRMMPGIPPMMPRGPMEQDQPGAGRLRPGDEDEPGRADPVSAAPAKDLTVTWDDGSESRIAIGAAVGNRNPVTVKTRDADGQAEVEYPATAFLDDQGTLHIDARGEPVAGPKSDGYSPDSFAIHADGSVTTRDDNDQTHHAHVAGNGGKQDAELPPKKRRGPRDM
ncbi:MAG: hypothetical protein H0W83_06770 [Planctomycetes bacterium]|nr:hypothetical protein [Planctomycetota bacterium]